MKQLVIISGKGGTGKTTLTASFASLAKNSIICDCDVDAADLYLLLNSKKYTREPYIGQKIGIINRKKCTLCGKCVAYCKFNAIKIDQNKNYIIDPIKCEGCSVCEYICPYKAITMQDSKDGQLYFVRNKYGPFFYAKLNPGKGNSGKLVTEVRKKAINLALKKKYGLIIIDGSPGIGCPVIASISGVNMALVVIEPTLSGEHDLKRILQLTKHFKVKTLVCINKCDINLKITKKIENICKKQKILLAGKISYNPIVTKAMIKKKPVVELPRNNIKEEIKKIWAVILSNLVIDKKHIK